MLETVDTTASEAIENEIAEETNIALELAYYATD